MNKQHLRKVHSIQTNVAIIKQIAAQELQHGSSQARKHAIESFYSSVTLHAQKLGLAVPRLGTFYQPEEYIVNCDSMLTQIEQKYGTEALAPESKKERGA